MVEYVLAAIVGAILAAVFFLTTRLLNQQQEQHAAIQALIRQQLDTIRQDVIQGRPNTDAMAADLHSLRRRFDEEAAARQTAAKVTAESIDQCNKKLDAISERLKPSVGIGSILPGSHLGDPYQPFQHNLPNWASQDPTGGLIFTDPNPFSIEPGYFGKRQASVFPDVKTPVAPGIAKTPRGVIKGFSPGPQIKVPVPSEPGGSTLESITDPAGGPPPAGPQTLATDAATDARRTIDLMFATTRKYDDAQERFTGERSSEITFGEAWVRVPETHDIGELERPQSFTLLSFTIYQQKEDPQKHFVIRNASILSKERWLEVLGARSSGDALVFVHGFNTSFEDALYRNAQIVWDLKFTGIPVLFSWPSRGAVADYVYDRDSALGARKPFIELLELLAAENNVQQIHVLAHSMGNQVVLDALANYKAGDQPLKLGELIMAAPDVDRDLYTSTAADARKHTKGMTLYASAADKALKVSKYLAGAVSRAGDVPENGPIVLDNIDSIDATSLGEDLFGLNHGTFAKSLSILNDVFQLLKKGERPPRVLEIKSMPEGVIPPKYWRYVAGRN